MKANKENLPEKARNVFKKAGDVFSRTVKKKRLSQKTASSSNLMRYV
jgi:hypothetical protein